MAKRREETNVMKSLVGVAVQELYLRSNFQPAMINRPEAMVISWSEVQVGPKIALKCLEYRDTDLRISRGPSGIRR